MAQGTDQGVVMNVMDILQQYAVRPTSTEQDFDEVVGKVPPEVLGDGLAAAFRSPQTPSFGQMAGQLFGRGNAQMRSGLLGQLVAAVAPAVLSRVAGGLFGARGSGTAGGASEAPAVRPEDLDQITPQQVEEIAAEAEKRDPGILDRVGGLTAKHPEAVKILGGAALAIALGQMAQRMKR
jgi:hypothetical protein